ncbi:MAG: magnesium chelatase, partial [Betaproteobacteria bacterium]|nr:magnesium chelatase [Betaproteobacteria bacterium]
MTTATPTAPATDLPRTLSALMKSGWRSRSVKEELRENMTRMLAAKENLFPGIVGYEDTVLPEIVNAMIAGHDMLFLGEKGQGKSRLMRSLIRFLDAELPYMDIPGCPVHEDPTKPITQMGRAMLANTP